MSIPPESLKFRGLNLLFPKQILESFKEFRKNSDQIYSTAEYGVDKPFKT